MQPRHAVVRWILIAASTWVLAPPAPARANGPRAHRYIVARAVGVLPDDVMRGVLANNLGAAFLGVHYPDVCVAPGVACGFENEPAHDHAVPGVSSADSFRQFFLERVRNASMTRADRLEAVAFLFGVIAHNEADDRFDSGFLSYALNRNLEGLDIVLCFDRNHPLIDCAFDYFVDSFATDVDPYVTDGWGGVNRWQSSPWDMPAATTTQAISDTYGRYGFAVTPDAVYQQIVDYVGVYLPPAELCGTVGDTCPFTGANWSTYTPGGLGDLVDWVSTQWLAFLTQEEPTTTLSVSPPQPDGAEGTYTSPVTVTVAASKGFGELESFCSLDGATPTTVTGPIEISTEGTHTVTCYTTDVTTRAGSSQSVTVNLSAPADSSGCSCGAGAGGFGFLGLVALLALTPRARARRRP